MSEDDPSAVGEGARESSGDGSPKRNAEDGSPHGPISRR